MLTMVAVCIIAGTATVMYQGFGAGIVLMAIKILLLFGLVFKKDLGKRNTWILFYILLGLDLILGFLYVEAAGLQVYKAASTLTRLLIDGTIGLAIKGKYDDKDARGTV